MIFNSSFLILRSSFFISACKCNQKQITRLAFSTTEKRLIQHFRPGLSEGEASSRRQIAEDHLGRAEQHRIDLVEVALIALKDAGEGCAVIRRGAGGHLGP